MSGWLMLFLIVLDLPRENRVEGSQANGDLNWSALKSQYQMDGDDLEVDPD